MLLLSLRLVEMGPTCFGVRFFVGSCVFALLLLLSLLRTSVVLRTIGDPNRGVFLARRELRSLRGEIGVVHAL